jgi:hypothetical protein
MANVCFAILEAGPAVIRTRWRKEWLTWITSIPKAIGSIQIGISTARAFLIQMVNRLSSYHRDCYTRVLRSRVEPHLRGIADDMCTTLNQIQ